MRNAHSSANRTTCYLVFAAALVFLAQPVILHASA